MQFEGSRRFNFIQSIWKSEAPVKCRVFAWLAILGKCKTTDCLVKKGMPHNAAYVLCPSQPESALHLLATCTVSIRLWRRILNSANLLANLVPNTGTTQLQDWLEETCHALPLANRKAWTNLVHLTDGTSGRSGTPGFSETMLLPLAMSMLVSSRKQRFGEMQEGARTLTCYRDHRSWTEIL
jgi:hypothetical protein